MRIALLRLTLAVVIVFQVFFAVMLVAAPDAFAAALGLPAAPEWALMIFALFSARALGLAWGLALAFRRPLRHRAWIAAMIAVQALDWIAGMVTVVAGPLELGQISTLAYMPLVFIAALAVLYPRTEAPASSRRPEVGAVPA